jgi:hypothetical protein
MCQTITTGRRVGLAVLPVDVLRANTLLPMLTFRLRGSRSSTNTRLQPCYRYAFHHLLHI